MRFRIDSDQRRIFQILGGLGGMMASGGNLVVMGVGAAVAVEGVMEEPVVELVQHAKEPVKRLVARVKQRFTF